MLGEQTELAMLAIPAFSAAIAALAPPRIEYLQRTDRGEHDRHGERRAEEFCVQSILETSFNTKGRNARPSMACRFRLASFCFVPPKGSPNRFD